MAPSRSSQAAGRAALCFALAGWARLAVSFVSPGAHGAASPRSLRGGGELQRFPAAPEEAAQEASHPLVGLAVCAATLGLAVTMVASPVQAEEEGADSQSTIAGKIARKKKKREAQVEEAKKAEAAPAAAAPAKKDAPAPAKAPAAPAKKEESAAPFSFPNLPSLPAIPNNFDFLNADKKDAKKEKPPESEPAPPKPFKVKEVNGEIKRYYNQSDELDYDEVPLGAPNPPVLAALLFGPSFIYLAFWVLGSLEII